MEGCRRVLIRFRDARASSSFVVSVPALISNAKIETCSSVPFRLPFFKLHMLFSSNPTRHYDKLEVMEALC